MTRRITTLKGVAFNLIKIVLILLGAVLICQAISQIVRARYSVFILFALAVILCARFTTGYGWGILAALIATIASFYFYWMPGFYLDLTRWGFYLVFLGMLMIAWMVSRMTIRMQDELQESLDRQEKTRWLNDINNRLLMGQGVEDTIAIALAAVGEFTSCTVILYLGDPKEGHSYIAELDDQDSENALTSYHERFLAHLVFERQVPGGFGGKFGLKAACTYLPLVTNPRSYHLVEDRKEMKKESIGVLGIYAEDQKKVKKRDLTLLNLMVSQIVMALERERLVERQQGIILENEKEKMRANLLRAVSHDLRTPLTGILGASTTLIENKLLLSETDQDKLIINIKEDANWLLHLVENLLSVTRIQGEHAEVKKEPQPVEEVVSEAILICKKRYPEALIQVQVPDELLLVPMDATLIEQVILNLLENAIKYAKSPEPIRLEVKKADHQAMFSITDDGVGITPDKLPTLFDGFSREATESTDSSKGMGIGLSICKTIIVAHGGNISAANRPEGGTRFAFYLPL